MNKEFNIGMASEHPDHVITVANSEPLHQSHLIEAFNLKAAIEYSLKNCMTSAYNAFRVIFTILIMQMPPQKKLCVICLPARNMIWMQLLYTM
jgi:hypothetical protein